MMIQLPAVSVGSLSAAAGIAPPENLFWTFSQSFQKKTSLLASKKRFYW
jgi:hypothetical protein